MRAGRAAIVPLLLFACAVAARAEWSVVSTEEQSAGRAGVRHVRATVEENGTRATVHLAVFSSKTATLRVIDDPQQSSDLASAMQRANAVAGVNGGYFTPEYAPVGLLVSDGRTIAPQQKARLLSGVVSVVNGRVNVQRVAEFSMKSKPQQARQCGPFLVERSKAVPGLNDTRPARRTFVAVAGGDHALVGYSSHVTLAQLGRILATPGLMSGITVQRALNLDGGSSSGFWFGGARPFSIREQKSVRDYLAVVPR
jgi:uncharacterized protein YigE (DUF2233 family)